MKRNYDIIQITSYNGAEGEAMHKLQSLNGIWDYRAAEGPWDKRAIPYADLPVGFAECRRTFDVPDGCVGRRAFQRLEGITYVADVTLKGEALGRMFPMFPTNLK